ncbi:MAG: AAA family ATPase [Deltaproteobacteria bacterium]|jgi:hypothetical protein|nr:AAA family ATPase [Deltaproteobacteria bacterium]
MTLKELPLGNQTFAEIVDQNYLYADKTKYVYDLLRSPKRNYFLSRPSRFGKTLLLTTIKELFSGNRERFKGLWIDSSDYDFPERPVLLLSLSMLAETPENFKAQLLSKLNDIAVAANVKVNNDFPDLCFGSLIKALYNRYESEVVVLIDEYDAPVTRNMGNLKVAQANAEILHAFFAILKDPDVASKTLLTLVTGITRYALTSMDSGPNHLNDISLDPKYAGLCGFILEEFDPLFGDRMEATLLSLKEAGLIKPSATQDDLRARIYKWYNGYNWGGQTRVLNPFSILNFFDQNRFDSYWIQSGRPAHLTALIRARPMDFLKPKLESYPSKAIRKSALTQLQAVPVLFHSGYLTIDKVTNIPEEDPQTNDTDMVESWSFRLPNKEVASEYNEDCFCAIFNREDSEDLKTKGKELRTAFLNRDTQKVSSLISDYIKPISYYQKTSGEETFHAHVHLILMAMGFNIDSELLGAKIRLDLRVELPERVYVIIELKYRHGEIKISPAKKKEALIDAAMTKIPKESLNKVLAKLAFKKLEISKFYDFTSKDDFANATQEEKDRVLAKVVMNSLSSADLNKVLVNTAKITLSSQEFDAVLYEAGGKPALSEDEIESVLSSAVQEALNVIEKKDYPGLVRRKAKEIICLGLAKYGQVPRVKAAFGPTLRVGT